ncbi:oligosaccharide flippase family protein [Vibrio splendidus]|uniref:oligosaccharide flippase family protein n=1 Tax=Vibrio splendidus TaxID=29497 RepID=UPI001FB31CC3|nr:oligosaccharide flippase family protein [Vibrio splendidus]UOE88710.1 oligosaccharide flippase family protein [Vibrio splendidus]
MLKNISIYAVFGVVAKSFSLLITPIIARNLSVEEFGSYIILISMIMLIQSVFLFGFEHSLNYFFNKFKSEYSKKILVSTQTIFILLVTLFFLIILNLLLSNKVDNINFILAWGAGSVLVAYFTTLLKVNLCVVAFVKNQMLQSVVLLCLVYIFLVVFSYSLQGIIYSYIASLLISIIFVYPHVKSYLSANFSINLLKKILVYGLPLMPSGALLWASMQLDRYFILYFLDEYSLGIYSFALAIVMIPLFLKGAVKSAIDPFIMKSYHNKPTQTKTIISNYFSLNLFVFSFLLIFLSSFSSDIVILMGGDKYLESTPYIPWLLLITCLTTCNQYFIYGINFSKKNSYILKGLFYMLFINVILMFLSIKYFGIYGVIFSNLIANAIYTLYLYIKSNELYPINHNRNHNLVILISMIFIFTVNVFVLDDGYMMKVLLLILYVFISIPKLLRGMLHG